MLKPRPPVTVVWYHEAIDYVVENGLIKGNGAIMFDPNGTATRGMIVTILYRLESEPAVSDICPYKEIKDGMTEVMPSFKSIEFYWFKTIWAIPGGFMIKYSYVVSRGTRKSIGTKALF